MMCADGCVRKKGGLEEFLVSFFVCHKCVAINRIYGFYDECRRRYNVKPWKTFCDVFNCLAVTAIVDEKIFCTHGGLSPDHTSMEQIRRKMRPTDVPDQGLLCDLLWSDPDKEIKGGGKRPWGVVHFQVGHCDALQEHDS